MPNPLDLHVIIPAAGKPTNNLLIHTDLPDTMLPINGKPIIGYILDDLISREIRNVSVILSDTDKHTENYISKKFGKRLNINIERNTQYSRGIGYSIYLALKNLSQDKSVLIYLGDTIYKGPLDFSDNFLVTASKYESSKKWCFVEETNAGLSFINKPDVYNSSGKVLAGLYFLNDINQFTNILSNLVSNKEVIEIHDMLEKYPHPFTLVPATDYYDCGNIENYYSAKIDFIKTRSFNTVIYNDLYGTITKTGTKKEKLLDEINWYKNVPNELKIFSPRMLDYNLDGARVDYTIEYYGYQTLADYFVFNHLDERMWFIIIDRLFDILALFKEYKSDIPFEFYEEIYKNKTLQRIQQLKQSSSWAQKLSTDNIIINGEKFKGWKYFEDKLDAITKYIYKNSSSTFVHGDPCLSNILFDPHSRIFKMIDPRGNFGGTSVYGDHNYDLAKLRHSFLSHYDFIISDLFDLEESNNKYDFSVYIEPQHQTIGNYFDESLVKRGYDLDVIKLIEGLLFISMIPLHDDAPERQKAMFLTGIQLLNKTTI